EPREEPVERLLSRETRDRRQDPERVRRQEDDRARMARPPRGPGVRDLLELVRGPRVLRLRVVVEIELPALVDDHVLEHGAEGASRPEDLGLGLRRETDHLRIAAALDVEDAALAPAVLVVADQMAGRVG